MTETEQEEQENKGSGEQEKKNSREEQDNQEDEPKVEGFEIFTSQNLIYLCWFLALYVIIYAVIRLLAPMNGGLSFVSRVFDFTILGLLALYLFYFFFYESSEQQKDVIVWTWDTTTAFVDDWTSIPWTFGFIVVLYITLFVTETPMTYDAKPMTIMLVETIVWLLLVVELLVQFSKAILKLDLSDIFAKFIQSLNMTPMVKTHDELASSALATGSSGYSALATSSSGSSGYSALATSSVTSSETPIHSPPIENKTEVKNEVFNINNNLYTYSDARAVCKSFGARLANYNDLERAYEDGAEWCSYGWSDDQMAFYPTQESTWNEIQKDPKRRNKCGRPGVNGGFMANPYLRLGVNCYGVKPKPTEAELAKMKRDKQSIGEPTDEQKDEMAKMALWQEHRDQLLNINAFNLTSWNTTK